MLSQLRRCTNCVLPETHETITFDDEGVCNICRQQEYKTKKVDWHEKREEFESIIDTHRGLDDYDCIVPFSGGKDTTYTLYFLVKEYNLKPLAVRFNHGFFRPKLQHYVSQTIRQMGVDLLDFTADWHLVRKLMLQSFLDNGDFCWHCHTGIFAYPMWVAIEKRIPLIIWGEPSSEYTAYYSYDQNEEVDEKRFNRYINLGISAQDMIYRLHGSVDERTMKPFNYPPLKELRRLRYRSICLGSYIPWDVKKQYAIIRNELNWKGDEVENVPPGYEYEKIECCFQGVRDYIKYIKRGYSRPTHLTAIDIRNNRLDRAAALEIIEKYEGRKPKSLETFLKCIGLTEGEFHQIAMSHSVSPYQHDITKTEEGVETGDYHACTSYTPIPKTEALEIMERWKKRPMD